MDSDELGVGAERIIVIEDLPEGPRRPSPGQSTRRCSQPSGARQGLNAIPSGSVRRSSIVIAAGYGLASGGV